MPYCTPLAEIFIVPEASTLLCLMVFLISTFYLFYFRDIRGSQIYTRAPYAPGRPLVEKFLYPKRVLHNIWLCFNVNILALVVSKILRWSLIYVKGPCALLYAPSGNFYCTRGEYFTISNVVFNFNFLVLLLSEILGGSQIYSRGPTPPRRPLAENFLYPKRVFHNV